MKLVIFEDDQFDRFLPLAWLRGVFELRTGATSLAEKIARAAGVPVDAFLTRDYLVPTLCRRWAGVAVNDLSGLGGQEVLFVNARVCGLSWRPPVEQVALWHEGRLAVWRTADEVTGIRDYAQLQAAASKAKSEEYSGRWYDYIWDLVLTNAEAIAADFDAAGRSGVEGKFHENAAVLGRQERLYVAEGAEVHPFVCIDTRGGPVTIEAGCEVHPFTRIEGPCHVGRGSVLLGAKIREGCSIGPVCRVGGEVEESIVHGYSNKYHDGFLGHAYVGEWVNLGALTTNSDLKNDYGAVSVVMGGKSVDTRSPKVGSFIGDHVKTSIGTLLNTGAVVGTMAVLVASGSLMPKYIPPFAWFLNEAIGKGFGLERLIRAGRVAMGRRKVEMTGEDERLLRHVFELTAEDRERYSRRYRKITGRL